MPDASSFPPSDDTPADPPPLDWRGWLEAALSLQAAPHDFEAFREASRRLYEALLTANRYANLTRLTAPDDFLRRHLLDSLVVSPYLPHGARVADVGSGAGFPGLPLALARPDLRLFAIEATGKKCRFIEAMRETLALKERLTVVHGRSEELTRNPAYGGAFDAVTARAVASLDKLAGWTLPLLRPGGCLLAIKGRPTARQELAQAQTVLRQRQARFRALYEPDHDWTRQTAIVAIEKA